MYVLEVIKFVTNDDIYKCGQLLHIGYMKAKFKTINDACTYYNKYNSHMRPLEDHNAYKSDWDPDTHLLYIVRKDLMLVDTIDPFSEEDLSVDGIYKIN